MRDGGGHRQAVWPVWAFALPLRILKLSNDWNPLSGVACQRRGPSFETSRTKEKVLLPEVEVTLKQIDEPLAMMEREETIRARWSHKGLTAKER